MIMYYGAEGWNLNLQLSSIEEKHIYIKKQLTNGKIML